MRSSISLISLPMLLLFATGCPPAESTDKPADSGDGAYDSDGDGFSGDDDCNEEDGTVHIGAAELCDGVDNDCNGEVDDGVTDATTFYADADGDGYGDDTVTTSACELPAGYVEAGGDCDDTSTAFNPAADESDCTDPADYNCDGSTGYADADADGVPACEDCNDVNADVFPGAVEVCNSVDDDCDGSMDEEAADAASWYVDSDADGYGSDSATTKACTQPEGYAAVGGDCDDSNSRYRPGAEEVDCTDPEDYNCDGSVGYADVDGDGYAACTECDDGNAANFPGATEYCDGADNNCDGAVDESSAVDAAIWYADADVDGFGDLASSTAACSVPEGYVADATDCDDSSAAVFPGATEMCNSIDDNCDSVVDEDSAADALTWYADADVDGFGDAAVTYISCAAPAGYLADNTDCDDANPATFPGADEYCNGADDNCNGETDEDSSVDASTWYADTDVDGYGDLGNTTVSCSSPAGFVADSTDCNDTDALVSPEGTESCNGIDDDCNGSVDEDTATDALIWFADEDADGFGDVAISLPACEAPAGFVADNADCDDSDGTEFPGADERCDGDDDNCDGVTDEDTAIDAQIWYADVDGDSFGDAATFDVECYVPGGYVADATDCNDSVNVINPAATEICDSANTDENCNGTADDDDAGATGQFTWYADTDGDAFGNAASTISTCDLPAGYVVDSTDCNDGDLAISPAAIEQCDAGNVDENCNGLADNNDPGAAGTVSYYLDADSDGYGNAAMSMLTCDLPSGYQTNSTDCDDDNGAINPAATEVCDSANTDEDCDGMADDADTSATGLFGWYVDADGDTFGAGSAFEACDQPAGQVASNTDCDDSASAINPSATEVCDGANTDEDCDGVADNDDASATGLSTYYTDADGDGYGVDASAAMACDAVGDQVLVGGDCDDGNSMFSPSAVEACDAANNDEDCDGLSDDADPDAIGQTSWYTDSDDDGYGNGSMGQSACDAPASTVADSTDCDDSNEDISPAASEVCDPTNTDEDCSGLADDLDSGATGQTTWYADADNDGYGDAGMSLATCDQPAGYVASSDDCDDAISSVNPGETEVCNNGDDDDCDGTDNGCSLTGADTAVNVASAYWYGSVASDGVGGSVGSVGDLDDDGADDVAFGTYSWDTTATADAGRAWFFSGASASGGTQLDSATLGIATVSGVYHNSAKDYVGRSVSGAGDFDNDGFLDVIVGGENTKYLPGGGGAAGEAIVYSQPVGELTRNSTEAILRVQGTAASWYVGSSTSGGLDVTGDSVPDLLVGGYGYDVTTSGNQGAAAIFAGGSTGTSSIASGTAFYTGSLSGGQAGQVVRLVNDLDGDGIDEATVAAYQYDGTATSAGRVYVMLGNASLVSGDLDTVADFTIDGPATTDAQFGRSLSSAGDMDDDGQADLWVGADQATVVDTATRAKAGTAYLFTGWASAAMDYADATTSLTGVIAGDFMGRSIAGDGDFNGDGFADVGVGATSYDTPASATGGVFVWYGPLAGGAHSGVTADTIVTGMLASDALGGPVSFAGDTNADGADDLLISGVNWDTPSGACSNCGGVFLVLGGGY